MTNRYIISIFVLLLSLYFVKVEGAREKLIQLLNVTQPLETGQSAEVTLKFISQPLPTDRSFDLVVTDVANNSTFEKIHTVTDDQYKFFKDNTYQVKIIVPVELREGDFKLYGFIDKEKISSSFPVKIKKSLVAPLSNNPNVSNVNVDPNNGGVKNGPNVSSPGGSAESQNGETSPSPSPIAKGIIILGVVASIVVIIFAILYTCCIRDSREKLSNRPYSLPPIVSEPQLISSSSPINATPLPFSNANTSFNNSFNASFSLLNPQSIGSPHMNSPLIHSSSNFSNGYGSDAQILPKMLGKNTSFQASRDSIPSPYIHPKNALLKNGSPYQSPHLRQDGSPFQSPHLRQEVNPYQSPHLRQDVNPYQSPHLRQDVNPYQSPHLRQDVNSYQSPHLRQEVTPFQPNKDDSLPRDNRNSNRDTFYSNNSNYISQDSMTSRDDEMPSPTPSYYYQLFKPHQVYRVLFDFKPSLPDEIEVQAGDMIRTEETFEDGWAFGVNMTTGKTGTFPMNCLEDDFGDNETKSCVSERSQCSKRSRRTSSLPNNQNIKTLQMMLDSISDDNNINIKDDNNNNNDKKTEEDKTNNTKEYKNNEFNHNNENFQKSYYISQANNTKV